MKKLLLLFIITGQTTFGVNKFAIDKKVIGSLALAGVGTIVTFWSGLSIFDQRDTIKTLKTDINSLNKVTTEEKRGIKTKISANAKRIGITSLSGYLDGDAGREDFLRILDQKKASYAMPFCCGAVSLALLFCGYRFHKSLKH